MKHLFTLLLIIISSVGIAKNKTWLSLKPDGSIAFKIEAKSVDQFSDGYAAVKISLVENNTWVTRLGFVDKTGQMVIPAIYDKTKGDGFVNGRAWVKKKDDKYWTLIDKKGNVIKTGDYDNVGYILSGNNNLLCVQQGDYKGFIDYDGKEIIPCKYIGSSSFSQGLACVATEESDGYGFINEKGEVVIPLKFKQAGVTTFTEYDLARAGVGGTTVLIDKTGKIVFKTGQGNIQSISNGWIRVFTSSRRDDWGYLDFNDQWKIKPIYDKLSDFNEQGWAEATLKGYTGIIDTTGKTILDFKYATLYLNPKEDGYIMGVLPVEKPSSLLNTPKDYFTPDLKPVDTTGIKYIYPAKGGELMPYLDHNEKKGYLSRDFKVAIPAKYSRAEIFSEGLAWVSE
ncbi:WG repeat-containing protein [Paracrocinitomix mangrovi]|uniref:WG repeat-containing protein n=1 Tax=Paracrocinitomix mangrovi TaxID=2862509 RepID=UPI001C8D02FF|nr:WG repeat-containing protein [Paracrocinitomix mangrovi]UKN03538.1 WG repeat-containing protein [Paracrocinitomix mangrovi]